MDNTYILFRQDNTASLELRDLAYPHIIGVFPTFELMQQAFEEDFTKECERIYAEDENIAIVKKIRPNKGTINASRYLGSYIFEDDTYGVRWQGLRVDEYDFNDRKIIDRTLFLDCE